jgi:hypothetical protein
MSIKISEQSVRVNGKLWGTVKGFCGLVSQNTVTGLRDEPLPDNVKWVIEVSNKTMYVLEFPPELRNVLWEDDYGYSRQRTIATPYVVMAVLFYEPGHMCAAIYYRNKPIKSLDDKLYYTNLYNTSSGAVCLDGLKPQYDWSHTQALSELVTHFWGGEFNQEITTNFFEAREYSNDERISTIERWEEESKRNPKFVLDVKWPKAHETLRTLAYDWLPGSISHAKHLGNLILAAK